MRVTDMDWNPERIIAERERISWLNRICVASKDVGSAMSPSSNSLREIKGMKQTYNENMRHIEKLRLRTPNDPVSILPLELFTVCISLALPLPERGYTSTLLQLTMVSRQWNEVILSISSLWASITVNGHDEDSLAMLVVSLYFSRDVIIFLTICPPLQEDWNQAYSVIIPHSHRIRGITLIGAPLSKEFYNHGPIWAGRMYCTALATILDSLGTPSSLVSINLGTNYALPMDWLVIPLGIHPAITTKPDNFCLPSNLQFMRQCSFRLSLLGNMTSSLVRLRELHTQEPISILWPILQQFSSLEDLSVTDTNWWHLYGEGFAPPCPVRPDPAGCELPKITSFTYAQPFSDTLLVVLPQIAPNLREAILRIPYSMVGFLISILHTMIRVHKISITLSQLQGDLKIPPRGITRRASAVYTLQSLSLRGYEKMVRPGKEVPTPNISELTGELISTLITLYPNVTHGHIELGHALGWHLVIPLLQNMRHLKSLSIYGNGEPSYEQINLPLLEELLVEGEDILSCFTALNVLRLTNEGDSRSQLQAFCQRAPVVRSLAFTDRFMDDASFSLDAAAFAHVCELQLMLAAYGLNETTIWPTIYLPVLHSLKKISLSGSDNVFLQATSLCLVLLFEPELCPTLQELYFEGYPEWDCLFLMLEARNFCRNSSISRISILTVSLIPNHLRSPLASLLRGEFISRPSNTDLSLEATREILLDENIPGCFTCLHSMKGACRAVVRQYNGQYNGINEWYVAPYGDEGYWAQLPELPLPPTTSQEVAKWVSGRAERIRRWKALTKKWGRSYQRGMICDERRYAEPVTITGDNG